MRVDQANRVQGMDQEHARLNRLGAALSPDNRSVTAGAAGHVSARPCAERRCALRRPRARWPNAGRAEWGGPYRATPPSRPPPAEEGDRRRLRLIARAREEGPRGGAANHGPAPAGRGARDPPAGGAERATRRAAGAAATAPASPALVRRGRRPQPAGGVAAPCLVVCLCEGAPAGWPAAHEADGGGCVHARGARKGGPPAAHLAGGAGEPAGRGFGVAAARRRFGATPARNVSRGPCGVGLACGPARPCSSSRAVRGRTDPASPVTGRCGMSG